MSAHQMFLAPWLGQAVKAQVLSDEQAWELQDLLLMSPEGGDLDYPPAWEPWLQRLHLMQLRPYNALPA